MVVIVGGTYGVVGVTDAGTVLAFSDSILSCNALSCASSESSGEIDPCSAEMGETGLDGCAFAEASADLVRGPIAP